MIHCLRPGISCCVSMSESKAGLFVSLCVIEASDHWEQSSGAQKAASTANHFEHCLGSRMPTLMANHLGQRSGRQMATSMGIAKSSAREARR